MSTEPRYPKVSVTLSDVSRPVRMLSLVSASLRASGATETDLAEVNDLPVLTDPEAMREELARWVHVR